MYPKVIVPLDGSRLSESILPYARLIAKAFDIPVEFLQVIDPEVIKAIAQPGRGFFLDVLEADVRRFTKDYLNTVSKSFDAGSSVRCRIEVGNPAEVIVSISIREPEALVAMSTHGRSGIRRWYVGSVADKVLHTCKNPMLVIKGSEDGQSHEGTANVKRLLVPLDGSPLAELALPHAVVLAKALNADIDLMRVYTALTHAYYGEGFIPNYEEMTETFRREASEYLEEKASMLKEEGLSHVKCIIEEGDAAAEIIDVAHKMKENLVAMCSHGRSGIGRWVLGGTADRVIRYSEDPIVVIRASE
jgi:nucleotide-binding universal stress UspA family protein